MPSDDRSRSISPPPGTKPDLPGERLPAEMPARRFLLPSIVTPVVLAIAIGLFVRLTVCQLFAIPSQSMAPTLHAGDRVVVVPYDSWIDPRLPERGDIVVFRDASGRGYVIKRIVGAPGDTLASSGGKVFRNDVVVEEPYLPAGVITPPFVAATLPGGSYFVMGDNRADSVDSRSFGPIHRSRIVGQAKFVLWSSGGTRGGTTAASSIPGGRFLVELQ